MSNLTRLTKADLAAIESEVAMLAGPPPTLEAVQADQRDSWLTGILDVISGLGRILTLAIVELVQAFGAVVLAGLFIALEADRVYHGVIALGQKTDQAALIALTLTAMNAVLPIYHLRNVTGQDMLTRVRWTVRGHLTAFWRRLTGRPQDYQVDVYNNPALAIAESTITWATLFLAFFAVLGPVLEQYTGQVWYSALWAIFATSSITQALGLLAGLLLSIGGVFGVQSISHELASRLLLERPARADDLLTARRADYESRVAALREQVRERYSAAKLADKDRAANPTQPAGMPEPVAAEDDTQPAEVVR